MLWSEETTRLVLGFGIGLGIGLLIGIERERHARHREMPDFAGIRTFPMIAMLGGLAGLMSATWGPWILLPPFLILGALVTSHYWSESKRQATRDPGLTTEIAALVVFVLGAIPFLPIVEVEFNQRLLIAGALGAIVMSLLSLSSPLHKAAEKMSKEDLYATVRFVMLAAVVLPLLPNRNFGRFDAFNPFWIGVVVVLLAGISFVGYLAVRWFGPQKGIGFTALFGGLISSTAVALDFSQRGKKAPALALLCAFAITIASSMMFPRIMIEIGAVAPALVPRALIPIGAMFLIAAIGSALIYHRAMKASTDHDGEHKFTNPFRLGQALKLGLIFAVVRFVAAAAHEWFGDRGLYVSALLAGITDVDAITVSVGRMFQAEAVPRDTAVFAIALAALSNTATKAGLALALGGKKLGLAVLFVLAPAAAIGLGLAWYLV